MIICTTTKSATGQFGLVKNSQAQSDFWGSHLQSFLRCGHSVYASMIPLMSTGRHGRGPSCPRVVLHDQKLSFRIKQSQLRTFESKFVTLIHSLWRWGSVQVIRHHILSVSTFLSPNMMPKHLFNTIIINPVYIYALEHRTRAQMQTLSHPAYWQLQVFCWHDQHPAAGDSWPTWLTRHQVD